MKIDITLTYVSKADRLQSKQSSINNKNICLIVNPDGKQSMKKTKIEKKLVKDIALSNKVGQKTVAFKSDKFWYSYRTHKKVTRNITKEDD